MLVADSFTVPGVGVVVTGRPELADIREGDRLWLHEGMARHEVTVRAVRLAACKRSVDPWVALAGVNTALVLDGVPEGVELPGRWLSSG
jgi:selenocysteine-specific translation elongation factor